MARGSHDPRAVPTVETLGPDPTTPACKVWRPRSRRRGRRYVRLGRFPDGSPGWVLQEVTLGGVDDGHSILHSVAWWGYALTCVDASCLAHDPALVTSQS